MAGDAALEAAQRRPHYGTHTLPSKSARGRSGSGRWVDFSNWDQQLSRWVGTSWGTVPVLLVVLLVVVITFGRGTASKCPLLHSSLLQGNLLHFVDNGN